MIWTEEQKKNHALLDKIQDEELEFVILDVETTGLFAKKDRIIEFSAIKCKSMDGEIFEYDDMDIYIKSPIPLPKEIVELTGITDEKLEKDGIMENEAVLRIKKFLEGTTLLSGYCVNFDIRFLEQLFMRNNISTEILDKVEVLDVYRNVMDTFEPKEVEDHKLSTINQYFGFKHDYHSSIEDVRATMEVIDKMRARYIALEAKKVGNEKGFKIQGMAHWKGPNKKLERIYVSVSGNGVNGALYFDKYHKVWCEKDEGLISRLDMNEMVRKVNEIAISEGYKDYVHFTGTYESGKRKP